MTQITTLTDGNGCPITDEAVIALLPRSLRREQYQLSESLLRELVLVCRDHWEHTPSVSTAQQLGRIDGFTIGVLATLATIRELTTHDR